MLGHQVHPVRLGRERRHAELGARRAVVAVVVVGADAPDAADAQDELDPARQRRLARGGVAGEGEQHRAQAGVARGHLGRDRGNGAVGHAGRERTAGVLRRGIGRMRPAVAPAVRCPRPITEPRGSRWETTRSAGTSSPHRSPSTASEPPPPPGRGTRPRRCRRASARRAVRRPPALRRRGPGVSRATTGSSCRKGTRRPALYATLKAMGAFDDEMLLSLRKEGSPLQGHPAPVPELPWVDVATGSLGQGLAAGLGMALAMRMDGIDCPRVGAARRLRDGRGLRVGGDGGDVVPRCEQRHRDPRHEPPGSARARRCTSWDADVFRDRALAFGWNALEIDGHDVDAIDDAYRAAEPPTTDPR